MVPFLWAGGIIAHTRPDVCTSYFRTSRFRTDGQAKPPSLTRGPHQDLLGKCTHPDNPISCEPDPALSTPGVFGRLRRADPRRRFRRHPEDEPRLGPVARATRLRRFVRTDDLRRHTVDGTRRHLPYPRGAATGRAASRPDRRCREPPGDHPSPPATPVGARPARRRAAGWRVRDHLDHPTHALRPVRRSGPSRRCRADAPGAAVPSEALRGRTTLPGHGEPAPPHPRCSAKGSEEGAARNDRGGGCHGVGVLPARLLLRRRSRDEDRRALESGQKSREQLRQENGLFSDMKVRVEFDKARALS